MTDLDERQRRPHLLQSHALGLAFFKRKFDPHWIPRYGAVRSRGDLPRFVVALLRMHLRRPSLSGGRGRPSAWLRRWLDGIRLPTGVRARWAATFRADDRARAAASLGTAVAAAAVTVAAWLAGGYRDGVVATLVDMGFDPGRAEFLAALLIGAGTAAIVTLVANRAATAIGLGALAVVALEGPAFLHDTSDALYGSAGAGPFDPLGWLLTLAAIVLAALGTAWAATTLAAPVRRWLASSVAALGELRRSRRISRSIARPGSLVAALLVVLLVGPVLGDMLNYGTDARLHAGGAARSGLFAGGNGLVASNGGGGVHRVFPSSLVGGPVADSLVTPGALASATPWTSAIPRGAGSTMRAYLPRFWKGRGSAYLDAYLPPGYRVQRARRYPVVYEVPYERAVWDNGMHLTATLDSLITTGQLPPEIVVFVPAYESGYPNSECSNSRDGSEWFDTWIVRTVVPWVDRTFRTIPTAAARTTIGASRGGYCAASLVTHHPDVFDSAISLSGFFVAGLQSSQTIGEDLVFGRDPAYEATQSPILRLPAIPATLRSRLFVVLCADPHAYVYGDQMYSFSAALDQYGVAQADLPTPLGHSWAAYRESAPIAIRLVAARQVELGVFGPA